MPKLNEIIAVVKDRKKAGQEALDEAYKKAQKPLMFEGMIREYNPLKEEGEKFPREVKNIELTVEILLDSLHDSISRMLETTRLQDEGNMFARADIEIEGGPTITDVPATHLLYLEKFAINIVTFIEKLPILDPGVTWTDDANIPGVSRSIPIESFRTKKEQRALVMYDATPHHPAQTQLITEDINVGIWKQTRLSGAISAGKKLEMLKRATKFRDAVRVAREKANSSDFINTGFPEIKKLVEFLLQ